MSAISALHNNIEGRPLGEHPEVSSLIENVFNNRPPLGSSIGTGLPKKNLPNNSTLSNKPLTFKVAMLLALT